MQGRENLEGRWEVAHPTMTLDGQPMRSAIQKLFRMYLRLLDFMHEAIYYSIRFPRGLNSLDWTSTVQQPVAGRVAAVHASPWPKLTRSR